MRKVVVASEYQFNPNDPKFKSLVEAWHDYRFPGGSNKKRMSDLAKTEWLKLANELGVFGKNEPVSKWSFISSALDKKVHYID